jgi:hypothetical protein
VLIGTCAAVYFVMALLSGAIRPAQIGRMLRRKI